MASTYVLLVIETVSPN